MTNPGVFQVQQTLRSKQRHKKTCDRISCRRQGLPNFLCIATVCGPWPVIIWPLTNGLPEFYLSSAEETSRVKDGNRTKNVRSEFLTKAKVQASVRIQTECGFLIGYHLTRNQSRISSARCRGNVPGEQSKRVRKKTDGNSCPRRVVQFPCASKRKKVPDWLIGWPVNNQRLHLSSVGKTSRLKDQNKGKKRTHACRNSTRPPIAPSIGREPIGNRICRGGRRKYAGRSMETMSNNS